MKRPGLHDPAGFRAIVGRLLLLAVLQALIWPMVQRLPVSVRASCGRVGTLVGFAVLQGGEIVGSTDAGSMARSVDGGHCWTAAVLSTAALHRLGEFMVDPSHPGVILAAGGNPVRIGFSLTSGLLRSTDNGRSWQQEGSGLPRTRFTVTALAQSRGTLYAALSCPDELQAIQRFQKPAIQCGRPIYRSHDGGASWQPTALGSETTPAQLPAPDFEAGVLALASAADGSVLAVAAPLDGAVGLYRSSDEGQTWHLAARDKRLRDTSALLAVAGRPGAILAGVGAIELSGQVLRSLDAGRTWSTVVNAGVLKDDLAVLSLIATPTGLFFIGYKRIFHSSDDGRTWSALPAQGLAATSNTILSAGPGGVLYLAKVGQFARSADGGLHWQRL